MPVVVAVAITLLPLSRRSKVQPASLPLGTVTFFTRAVARWTLVKVHEKVWPASWTKSTVNEQDAEGWPGSYLSAGTPAGGEVSVMV